ncbi:MAG: ATP-dependent DNA helicase RecG [Planctomycetota bacterium]
MSQKRPADSASGLAASESTVRSIGELSGVGPARVADFAALGIHDTRALIARFPRRYRTRPPLGKAAGLVTGQAATVIGTVLKQQHRSSRRRKGGHLKVVLDCAGQEVSLQFFNQGWLRGSFTPGMQLAACGVVSAESSCELRVSDYLTGDDINEVELNRPIAVHATIGSIKPKTLQTLIAAALAVEWEQLEDPLPAELRSKRDLLSLRETLEGIHFPPSDQVLAAVDRRLVYQGFFARALRIEGAKRSRSRLALQSKFRRGIQVTLEEIQRVLRVFPFEFTKGQSQALDDVVQDLASEVPMRRLVQGDVGCGKTAVAAAAAILVARAARQVAILAPTEALARQFFREIKARAAELGVESELLIGANTAKDRRRALAGLSEGRVRIVVGTHALIADGVNFKCLGLVIVDEQHRFGVMQRLRLVRKGEHPHLLAMSATPIPRTLALSLFSDLETSSIRERPPGRRRVQTVNHVADRDGKFDWGGLADSVRSNGEKIFIVFPAIESESSSIPTLLGHGRAIAKRFFRGIAVAAVHGRMKPDEKAQNLESFRSGPVRVLFATTVIEVGVDIPDATTIVILGANRFGLAQLHQLRGRVGRGSQGGRCILLSKGKAAAESERLSALLETDDGFEIAERDLDLRGPGDMMGLRQHGLIPTTRHAEDEDLLAEAFEDARDYLDRGEELAAALEFWSRHRPVRGRELIDAG